ILRCLLAGGRSRVLPDFTGAQHPVLQQTADLYPIGSGKRLDHLDEFSDDALISFFWNIVKRPAGVKQ
ncbi:MAG: hypothetical protein WAV08_11550, partial [Desulfobacterales bacterium]